MFDETIERQLFNDLCCKVDDIDKRISDMGVKYRTFAGISFEHILNTVDNCKFSRENIECLQGVATKCIDGVRELDRFMGMLMSMRDSLVNNVFRIRDAFPGFNDTTGKMRLLANDKSVEDKKHKTRELFAEFLGYKELPDTLVNVGFYMNDHNLEVGFGVKDTPTRMVAVIPMSIDHPKDVWECFMNDEFGNHKLSEVAIEELEKLVPMLKLLVSVGTGGKDTRCLLLKDVDGLRYAIEDMSGYDSRTYIKPITDISDVKNADDLSAWRMLRSANKRAAENAE